jgi:glyoxylase-like metal-dependent hydrolase (beta-lactamase superfamily II)
VNARFKVPFVRRVCRPGALVAAVAGALACAHGARSPATGAQAVLPASWYVGGKTCVDDAQFRVHAVNPDFVILRQVACTNFEKPFLYLLFGRERALLLDTGAGGVRVASTVDTLVNAWLARTGRPGIDLIVAHSHAHRDHVAGDSQFVQRPRTMVVGRDSASVRRWLGIARWPEETGSIDLGDRVLDVIPIPGHEPASIAIYDRRTRIMLTGDTFYPGRLYVRDTAAFAQSIARLAGFARSHPVTHLLGAHIENTRTPSVDYPVGTVDQPEEHVLELSTSQLVQLDSVVRTMRGRITRTVLRDLTIWPPVP